MKIKRIYRKDCKSSQWSGGTTTEFFLYPKDGSYAARDFQVRISSATVDLEESVFTSLPGVERWLTILKGEMKLMHTGRYARTLAPYEVEHFGGDWETKSQGKAVDFNLMLQKGAKGNLYCLMISPGQTADLEPQAKEDMLFLFAAEGSFRIGGSQAGEKRLEEAVACQDAAILWDWKLEKIVLANPGEEPAVLIVCALALGQEEGDKKHDT